MLPLLLILSTRSTQATSADPYLAIEQHFKEAGVAVEINRQARTGVAKDESTSVNLAFMLGPKQEPMGIEFRKVYAATRPVSNGQIALWNSESQFPQAGQFRASAAGTVSFEWEFMLNQSGDPALVKQIETLFRSLHNFEANFAVVAPTGVGSQNVKRIQDNAIIDYSDPTAIAAIIARKGWTHKGSFGYSSPTWVLPATVGEVFVTITGSPNLDPYSSFYIHAEFILPDSVDLESWKSKNLKDSNLQIARGSRANSAILRDHVDVGAGMSVKGIIDRIQSLASRAKRFQTSAKYNWFDEIEVI